MHDQTRAKEFAEDTGTSVDAGNQASAGAKIAASIGGALAAIVAAAMSKRNDAANRSSTPPVTIDTGVARTVSDLSPSSTGAVRGLGLGDVELGDLGASSTGVLHGPGDVSSASPGTIQADLLQDAADSTMRTSASSGSAGLSTGVGAQATSPTPSSTTVGPVTPTVAGPLAGILASAGLGGLIGALVGAGIPKDVAQRYNHELTLGGILIGVEARSADESSVREILNDRSNSTSPSSAPKTSTP